MRELRGAAVAENLNRQSAAKIEDLRKNGIIPKLAVVRVGRNESDLSYERGILKRFSSANALVEVFELPEDAAQNELEDIINNLNTDNSVHGILLFRPLPKHLSIEPIKRLIDPRKDVDCMGSLNTAAVFEGDKNAFAPCTAQAVIEILEHYGIGLSGKKAVVVGRSLVVGKPLAMLLLGKNTTVTVCHTKTEDLPKECLAADVLIACAGVPKLIGAGYVRSGQTVIDVGIHVIDGSLCGDVDFEAVSDTAEALTPVPGGVGAVTTAVLLKNTVRSADLHVFKYVLQ